MCIWVVGRDLSSGYNRRVEKILTRGKIASTTRDPIKNSCGGMEGSEHSTLKIKPLSL